jgi:hypothetical protein
MDKHPAISLRLTIVKSTQNRYDCYIHFQIRYNNLVPALMQKKQQLQYTQEEL